MIAFRKIAENAQQQNLTILENMIDENGVGETEPTHLLGGINMATTWMWLHVTSWNPHVFSLVDVHDKPQGIAPQPKLIFVFQNYCVIPKSNDGRDISLYMLDSIEDTNCLFHKMKSMIGEENHRMFLRCVVTGVCSGKPMDNETAHGKSTNQCSHVRNPKRLAASTDAER